MLCQIHLISQCFVVYLWLRDTGTFTILQWMVLDKSVCNLPEHWGVKYILQHHNIMDIWLFNPGDIKLLGLKFEPCNLRDGAANYFKIDKLTDVFCIPYGFQYQAYERSFFWPQQLQSLLSQLLHFLSRVLYNHQKGISDNFLSSGGFDSQPHLPLYYPTTVRQLPWQAQ